MENLKFIIYYSEKIKEEKIKHVYNNNKMPKKNFGL